MHTHNMPLPTQTQFPAVSVEGETMPESEGNITNETMNQERRLHIVRILHEGYSRIEEKTGDIFANCTCTFIKGHTYNIIVDTMTAWDANKIVDALLPQSPDSINYVVCTHGHSDHIGNNHLFKNAVHVVGCSMSSRERYFNVELENGKEFLIEPGIKIVPTPGHTANDVSVLVDTGEPGSSPTALGLVAITGDLFEREEDLTDDSLWRKLGGSEQPELQERNRAKILAIADYIIPGHGPMFRNNAKTCNETLDRQAGPSTA